MKKLFISYRSSDRGLVEELITDLIDKDHEVWYDRELEAGQLWWDTILENIRACDVFVFALTPASLESKPCKLEYTYAHELGKPILPVLLIPVDYSLLPPIIQERQIIDYTSRDKQAFKQLVSALQALQAAPPLPDPLPPPPAIPLSPLAAVSEIIDNPQLSYDQQLIVLHQLKQLIDNPTYSTEAYVLLGRFKEHPSLLASVLKELQAIPPPTAQKTSDPAAKAGSIHSASLPFDLSLAEGESMVKQIKARYFKAFGYEGTLFITSERIIFLHQQHTENVDIPLKNVGTVTQVNRVIDFLIPTLRIVTRSGGAFHFQTSENTALIQLILQLLKQR